MSADRTGVDPMGEDPRLERALPGIRFLPRGSLADRAVSLLEASPMPGDALARRLFRLRAAPPDIALRLLDDVLGSDPRVGRSSAGLWRLVEPPPTTGRHALDELRFAVVDVETTGGMAEGNGRVIEIAAAHVEGGRVGPVFSSLVNPGIPVSAWVSRLTGINNRMVVDAPSFRRLSDEVRRRLEGRIFVAHNVGFDWRFVSAEMQRAQSLVPSGPRLCTVHLARRVVPGLRRRGLGSLAHYYGVEIEGRHRARGDAVATAAVLVHLLADAQRQGVTRWNELQGWLAGPGGRRSRGVGAASAAQPKS